MLSGAVKAKPSLARGCEARMLLPSSVLPRSTREVSAVCIRSWRHQFSSDLRLRMAFWGCRSLLCHLLPHV